MSEKAVTARAQDGTGRPRLDPDPDAAWRQLKREWRAYQAEYETGGIGRLTYDEIVRVFMETTRGRKVGGMDSDEARDEFIASVLVADRELAMFISSALRDGRIERTVARARSLDDFRAYIRLNVRHFLGRQASDDTVRRLMKRSYEFVRKEKYLQVLRPDPARARRKVGARARVDAFCRTGPPPEDREARPEERSRVLQTTRWFPLERGLGTDKRPPRVMATEVLEIFVGAITHELARPKTPCVGTSTSHVRYLLARPGPCVVQGTTLRACFEDLIHPWLVPEAVAMDYVVPKREGRAEPRSGDDAPDAGAARGLQRDIYDRARRAVKDLDGYQRTLLAAQFNKEKGWEIAERVGKARSTVVGDTATVAGILRNHFDQSDFADAQAMHDGLILALAEEAGDG